MELYFSVNSRGSKSNDKREASQMIKRKKKKTGFCMSSGFLVSHLTAVQSQLPLAHFSSLQ